MAKLTLALYLLALGIVGPMQEAKDDGSICSTKGGTARGLTVHECHCRLQCSTDDDGNVTYGEEGGPDTSPTRCAKYCVKGACDCHPEPTPKDCDAHQH